MTSEERRAWLSGLKMGSPVAIVNNRFGPPVITQVTRITKTQISVKHRPTKFRKCDGSAIGDNGSYNWPEIAPVTDEVQCLLDRYRLNGLLLKANSLSDNLPIATVRKLLAVLAEAEGEQGKENA